MKTSFRSLLSKVLVCFGIVFCFGVSPVFATAPLEGAELAKFQNCEDDVDCVYVQNGSCDCNNGGMGVAINRTMLDKFKKNFAPVVCGTIQGASCTNGLPRSEQNKCLYYAHVIPHPYTQKKKH